MKFRLLFLCFALAAVPALASADAEADWQAVQALEAGPQGAAEVHTREQARTLALSHLARQEAALREFMKAHPSSPHAVDAQLAYARLLSTRSDLSGNPADYQAALGLLQKGLTTAPEDRRADYEFAALTLAMRHMSVPTDQDRDALTAQALNFQTRYPNDRRVAALLAEVATLHDNQPQRKGELLGLALAAARTPEVRARIEDDLHRLSFLGQPIEVKGPTVNGASADLASFRGRVALVYFFASWSAPSVMRLDEVEYLRKTLGPQGLSVLGVSLDTSREALNELLLTRHLTWPVIFDGMSWKSPLIRGLSLNALPTLWIVDRQGNLRTLNARTESEALVRALLRENP